MKIIDKIVDSISEKRNKNELYEQYIIEGGERKKPIPDRKKLTITQTITGISLFIASLLQMLDQTDKNIIPKNISLYIYFTLMIIGYGVGIDAIKTIKEKTKKQTITYILFFLLPFVTIILTKFLK